MLPEKIYFKFTLRENFIRLVLPDEKYFDTV